MPVAGIQSPLLLLAPGHGLAWARAGSAPSSSSKTRRTHGKIVMACMTPAAEEPAYRSTIRRRRHSAAGVIEWLMINHPHDCPVCDEGGECHLQDMTVMTGHDYRRDPIQKTDSSEPKPGPFINHEMNRCIQCYRCVRYYRDYAGGRDFDVFGCNYEVYFGRSEPGVLENEFSGNLVEVCPTGVFTDKTAVNALHPQVGYDGRAFHLRSLRAGLQHYHRGARYGYAAPDCESL